MVALSYTVVLAFHFITPIFNHYTVPQSIIRGSRCTLHTRLAPWAFDLSPTSAPFPANCHLLMQHHFEVFRFLTSDFYLLKENLSV